MQNDISRKKLSVWRHHLHDEVDASYLYAALAGLSDDKPSRHVFTGLANVEKRHVEVWKTIFEEHGVAIDVPHPSLRARFQLLLARWFGTSFLVEMLVREETDEVRGYLRLHSQSNPGLERDSAQSLARESAQHIEALSSLTGSPEEPWHRAGVGGLLRNIIYGFNDGLTANFGLVAGVIGASVAHEFVVLSGIAGAVADALSMGASGYLAARSEQEVYDNEIRMERDEIRLMPDLEREELALIYQARGVDSERARAMAAETMRDPERALEEKIREELKITRAHSTPWREAWVTGLATAIGAVIPVVPFLFAKGWSAVGISFALAMCMHFGVGAARSAFTGRPFVRSGVDMFAVGFGVAVVGYLIGDLIMSWV